MATLQRYSLPARSAAARHLLTACFRAGEGLWNGCQAFENANANELRHAYGMSVEQQLACSLLPLRHVASAESCATAESWQQSIPSG